MTSFPSVVKQLGRRVKELRKARGWSQEKLAHGAEISRTYMGTIELGAKQPTLKTLYRIAKALNVPLAEVFLSPTEDQGEGAGIVALIHTKLLEKGRTMAELRRVERVVNASLHKGR